MVRVMKRVIISRNSDEEENRPRHHASDCMLPICRFIFKRYELIGKSGVTTKKTVDEGRRHACYNSRTSKTF